jgi:hypothetical protein
MTRVSRRVLSLVCLIALGSLTVACASGNATGAVGTSGESAFVALDVSQPSVVLVENKTGQPLVDVTLTIKSGILGFTDRVSRLEATEKRPLRHSDFTSRDGTSFNLRVARPKEIEVSAKDLNGKQFSTTMPW